MRSARALGASTGEQSGISTSGSLPRVEADRWRGSAIIGPCDALLRILSVALITAGLVILIDAGLTLAWKEPVSAIYAQLQQDQARSELDSLTSGFLEGTDLSGTGGARSMAAKARIAKRLANAFEDEIRNGEGIGQIQSEPVGFDYVMIQGTDTAALKKGPGRYPETALPGQGRTIGIAGHRTTYGAPFRKINEIDEGDGSRSRCPTGPSPTSSRSRGSWSPRQPRSSATSAASGWS